MITTNDDFTLTINPHNVDALYIKKLYSDAIVPTKGTSYSAGFDLYAHNIKDVIENKDYTDFKYFTIRPNETVKVGTGIALEIPEKCFGGIFARSGLATKQGLRPSNCVGVIDSDYRGEIIVALHNDSDKPQQINFGDRIAQLVLIPYLLSYVQLVDDLSETDRGNGGFGSTGSN